MVTSRRSNEAKKRIPVIASAFAVIVIATAAAEVGPPFPQPYVVDPDRTGAVEAVWSREEGLPDVTEGQHYAMSLRIDAPIPGLEAGVRLLGVDGRESLGSELGFDFRNDTGCGEWPQIHVVQSLILQQDLQRLFDLLGVRRLPDLRAVGEVTDVYRCRDGEILDAPADPEAWKRVRFNVQPVRPGFSIRDVKIVWKGEPSRILIDNIRMFEVVIGWPGLSIYVADSCNNRIVEIDNLTDSGWYARWATHGTAGGGANQFRLPQDVHVDSRGRIYVADFDNHRIARIDDISGSGWVTFGTQGSGSGEFRFPTGVVVDDSDRIHVADRNNNRIVRVDDMAGGGWTAFGTYGSGPGEFDSPYEVAVDGFNRLYVTDNRNGRIARMDGMTGASWITLGPCVGGQCFQFPYGVAVDAFGVVYFNTLAALYRVYDMFGSGFTSYAPSWQQRFHRVATDDLGRIYLTRFAGDYGLTRMRDIGGNGRIDVGTGGSGVGQFHTPEGVYVIGREASPCPCP